MPTRPRREAPAKPGRAARSAPRAPRHLERREAQLWRSIAEQFDFSDPASQALLQVACESHQRARGCRERIDAEGATITDRFGQVKGHPLLAAERDARAAFLAAIRALNLDLGASL